MPRRLSLIAGSGGLPVQVLDAARRNGDQVQVLTVTDRRGLGEATRVAVSELRPIIRLIRHFRSTHLVLAGSLHLTDEERESIASAMGRDAPDGRGDTALSRVAGYLARESGTRLIGAQDVAPGLLAGEGLLAGPRVTDAVVAASRKALVQARATGRLDLGQALVMSGGRVIAVEDIGGTDALIGRIAQLKRRGLVGRAGIPVILAKASKPAQPLTVDLPAIGAKTVMRAASAGIGVIVVEARRTLVLERERIGLEATRRGVTVLGLVARNE